MFGVSSLLGSQMPKQNEKSVQFDYRSHLINVLPVCGGGGSGGGGGPTLGGIG